MDDLSSLRRQLKAKRAALSAKQRHQAAKDAARYLVHTRLFRAAKRIAVYMPKGGELDPAFVIRAARLAGKSLYLPVLGTALDKRLRFAPWYAHTPLGLNRFAIEEPESSDKCLIRPKDLDLVITPLVGFDRHGNRLGMGGGYYDTTFAFLNYRRHWRKPYLLGFAYACQELPHIQVRSWDVRLIAIATENGIHWAKMEQPLPVYA